MILIIPEGIRRFTGPAGCQKLLLCPSDMIIPLLKVHFLIRLSDDLQYGIPVTGIYFRQPRAEGYLLNPRILLLCFPEPIFYFSNTRFRFRKAHSVKSEDKFITAHPEYHITLLQAFSDRISQT